MFGFSLTKILFTILVVVAVWRVFTMLERYRKVTKTPTANGRPKALEFRECPRCGDYVAKDADCPRCRGSA